jgi:serine/threonine-protein kinase RsbW
MSEPGHVRMRLPAKAENVALVRQAVSGVAEALSVEPSRVADMKTAVTEACNNVVLHAYPEAEGTLEVDANPNGDWVTIVVRDHGGGMQPKSVQPDKPSLGLGLPLIAALSDRFEILGGSDRGIEVRMLFQLAEEALPEVGNGDIGLAAPAPPARHVSAAGVAITPGPMLAPVLGRMTAMLAARADFPLDRLSDAVLVMDAIAANVTRFIAGPDASVTFQDGSNKVDVRVGPLVEGGGGELVKLMELPGLDRSLEQLADEVRVEPESGDTEADRDDDRQAGEYLFVRLSSES